MSRFIDYEASNITPQMTLLQKFNEMSKFLRQSDYRNLHKYRLNYQHSSTTASIDFISSSEITIDNVLINVFKFVNGHYANNPLSKVFVDDEALKVNYVSVGAVQEKTLLLSRCIISDLGVI